MHILKVDIDGAAVTDFAKWRRFGRQAAIFLRFGRERIATCVSSKACAGWAQRAAHTPLSWHLRTFQRQIGVRRANREQSTVTQQLTSDADPAPHTRDKSPQRSDADIAVPAYFSIREVANEFDVTLRALRFYETKGLLRPQRFGPSRLYSRADLGRLALILQGKRLGFTLGEISELIAGGDRERADALQLSPQQRNEQIRLLMQRKHDIERALAELNSDNIRSATDSEGPRMSAHDN